MQKAISFILLACIFLNHSSYALESVIPVSVKLKLSYAPGQTSLKKLERRAVEDLKDLLEKLQAEKVYIVGHTDSSGPYDLNKRVAKARAEFVLKQLGSNVLEKNRIEAVGYGESSPIASNGTKAGRQENRRVVVSFFGLKQQDVKKLEGLVESLDRVSFEASPEEVKSFISSNSSNEELSKNREEARPLDKAQLDLPVYRYSLILSGYQGKLRADNLNGVLHSKWESDLNVAFGGVFQANVSDHFWLGFGFEGHIQNYEPESTGLVWDDEVPFLLKSAIKADYESLRWGLGADLNYNKESFAFDEAGVTDLRDEFLMGLGLRFKYKWYEKGRLSSRLHFGAALPFTGNGDKGAEGKLGYQLALDLRKGVSKSHSFGLKFYYEHKSFSNDQNTQEEEILGLKLSLDSKNWL